MGTNIYQVGRVRGSYYPYPTRPVDIPSSHPPKVSSKTATTSTPTEKVIIAKERQTTQDRNTEEG